MYTQSRLNNYVDSLKEKTRSGLGNYNYFKKSAIECFETNVAAPLLKKTCVNKYVSNKTIAKYFIRSLECAMFPPPLSLPVKVSVKVMKYAINYSENIENLLTTEGQKEKTTAIEEKIAPSVIADNAFNNAQQNLNNSAIESTSAAASFSNATINYKKAITSAASKECITTLNTEEFLDG